MRARLTNKRTYEKLHSVGVEPDSEIFHVANATARFAQAAEDASCSRYLEAEFRVPESGSTNPPDSGAPRLNNRPNRAFGKGSSWSAGEGDDQSNRLSIQSL